VKDHNKEMSHSPLESGGGHDLTIEELLFGIIITLVDDRNEVRLTSVTKVSGRVFQVTVAPTDVGKVIGKGGRTATSIRGCYRRWGTPQRSDMGWR
jgi:uncharacterized protein